MKSKKPSLMERIGEKMLMVLYLLLYFPLWLVIFLLRFPFLWLGKIADVLEDMERGLNHSTAAFSEVIAALTPECEWKYQYEKLKKKTEEKDNDERH